MKPAITPSLLLRGLPTSRQMFRGLIPGLATLVGMSGAYAPNFRPPPFVLDYQSLFARVAGSGRRIKSDELRFQPTVLTQDPAGDLECANEAALHLAQTHGRI